MNYHNIASHIFCRENLQDKLVINEEPFEEILSEVPQRNSQLSFSTKQIKFPKASHLVDDNKKALALHFFANHELLAIELFAWAIIKFDLEERESKTLIKTIREEQKHLKLYLDRMKDFGVELGDYPLNDFLWKTVSQSENFEQFYSLMALTFEQANLDFMKYFLDVFKELGDDKTCKILETVYQDEITHVARGKGYLSFQSGNDELWNYYIALLSNKISPARAKGMLFDEEARLKAGLDQVYIAKLKEYKDEFKVTNRKEWKKDSL